MRTLLASLLVCALLPALAAAAGPCHVRVTSFSPAVVRGTGFVPRERVAVTVRAGATKLVAHVFASRSGAFIARFARDLPPGGCTGVAVAAVGAHGDRAAWKSTPASCGNQPAP